MIRYVCWMLMVASAHDARIESGHRKPRVDSLVLSIQHIIRLRHLIQILTVIQYATSIITGKQVRCQTIQIITNFQCEIINKQIQNVMQWSDLNILFCPTSIHYFSTVYKNFAAHTVFITINKFVYWTTHNIINLKQNHWLCSIRGPEINKTLSF